MTLQLQKKVKSQFSKSSSLIFKEIAPILGTYGQFFGRPRFYDYKGIKSCYTGQRRPSPHPSPPRGEEWMRGPLVKKNKRVCISYGTGKTATART